MFKTQSTTSRPMRVFVKPGSQAERVCRTYAAQKKIASTTARAQNAAIAEGFKPLPALDLHDRGGKIIRDLVFTNFYVGASAWDESDIQNIDDKLAKAMGDRNLNNVIVQYFRGANISSTFRPSSRLSGSPPESMSQADVEALVKQLHAGGKLNGFDFGSSVFNFMLPRNTVLTIDDGSDDDSPTGHASGGETDEKASSSEGLGGFHGSVRIANGQIYYAVGVYSQGNNGIDAFGVPWKNVVATFYHELNEARTDAGVEDDQVAWLNNETPSEEIGDIPMTLAGADLSKVMVEVPLTDGSDTVPIQLMWSNGAHGPEGPITTPRPPTQ
jgi:hypothetical protein